MQTESYASGIDEDVADRYVDLLLDRQRARAVAMVTDLVDSGVDVRDVYLRVLEPAQQHIGTLWQHGEITVAQEHYCTAATQQAIAAMYPHVFAADPDGRHAVVACVSGELHELGSRMVADFLQMDGWDTSYLSANVPLGDIAAEVVTTGADLLCCSAALPDKVPLVERTISLVRERRPDIPILVGGRAFTVAQGLWEAVGADGTAKDARGAVTRATELVPRPTPGGP